MKLQRIGTVEDKVFEDFALRKMMAWYQQFPTTKATKSQAKTRTMPVLPYGDGGEEYEYVAQPQTSDGDYGLRQLPTTREWPLTTRTLRRLAELTLDHLFKFSIQQKEAITKVIK